MPYLIVKSTKTILKKEKTMATAIDVVTLFHALSALEDEFLGKDRMWEGKNTDQKYILGLYAKNKALLSKLKGLKSKASIEWQVLNDFLKKDHFDPMFDEPFEGIGAVSILDMLVKWLYTASLVEIYGKDQQFHTGFEIPEVGREAFKVGNQHLARLKTKSGDFLWLVTTEAQPQSPFALVRYAFSTMEMAREPDRLVTTVQVPEVDFDIKPDIRFVVGVSTHDKNDAYWYIAQAKQQFKLRINKEGAHAKVSTGLVAKRGGPMPDEPQPLVFNKPFVGWFTQKAAPNLPIAIFYADYSCWKHTTGLNLR